ncbi:hypothetical protein [Actinoplanes sp. NPDC049265]|uniref:hypothetical protein n=1 Tax=Actinoplanes sp. NPDC049265 TaxID=3363902 RepID=UPI003722B19B
MTDPRESLRAATLRYRSTAAEHEEARKEAIEAVLDALRSGLAPVEVEQLSPFTGAYIRRIARDSGIPPAAPGPKRV